MTRISKAAVNQALNTVADDLINAAGTDGRISRAEAKAAISKLSGCEKSLADIFFKFVDNRDFKTGATVTKADIKRALAYAKKHMIAKYDVNNNGLSKDEIAKMSLTGKLAVQLARELKENGDTHEIHMKYGVPFPVANDG